MGNLLSPECAEHFIATSALVYRLQPDPTRCTLIPNGIDLERFHGRRTHGVPHAIVRICRPEKYAEFFWYAMLPVLADYPTTELCLAGAEGSSSHQIRTLGVIMDVAEILAQSYLFVHTPRPGEGTRDLAVMEAMTMGVPCVLGDVPCVREAAADEGCAALVPHNDVPRLTVALRHLLDEAEEAERMGVRARRYAIEHFNMRPRVASYERVYAAVTRRQ